MGDQPGFESFKLFLLLLEQVLCSVVHVLGMDHDLLLHLEPDYAGLGELVDEHQGLGLNAGGESDHLGLFLELFRPDLRLFAEVGLC